MSKKWLISFVFLFSISCKTSELTPEDAPTVILKEVSNVTIRSIKLIGEVTNEGYTASTDRGFVYSEKNTNPSVSDLKVSSGYGKGEYSVILNNLPVNTKYYIRAYSTNLKGTSYSDVKTINSFSVVNVISKTGKIWMDRNLGATQVATSLTDDKSYGDLYQWGRGADGHQIRISSTEPFNPINKTINNSNFITTNIEPFDWQSQKNDNTWLGENGINCPCPTGYRIPTSEEWKSEIETWNTPNSIGGFASILKLPLAGLRDINGNVITEGFNGWYWSSDVYYGGVNTYPTPYYLSGSLYYTLNGAYPKFYIYRGKGASIRCIKN